jgi:ABC-type branched-subunit amino acid transport system substrate-binding protein
VVNEAGLLECSASAASEELTAIELPADHPNRTSFVRTVATNDSEAPATARFVLETLGSSSVYVIDNAFESSHRRAEQFATSFQERGGDVVDQQSIPETTTDLTAIFTRAKAQGVDTFYFSGSSGAGAFAARLLNEMRNVLPDAVFVASGEAFGSSADFLSEANDLSNVYTAYEAVGDFPDREAFGDRYFSEFGGDPRIYSSTGYACAEVILDAISRAGVPADLAALREAVRAAAVDPGITYDSLIGDFHFDEKGEISTQIITFYRGDPVSRSWVLFQSLDATG